MGVNESPEFGDVLNDSYISSKITVGTTQVEAKVGSSPLAGRELLTIYNDGPHPIFYGPSGVTTSGANMGVRIEKKQFVSIPAGQYINVYLISTNAGNNVVIQEFA